MDYQNAVIGTFIITSSGGEGSYKFEEQVQSFGLVNSKLIITPNENVPNGTLFQLSFVDHDYEIKSKRPKRPIAVPDSYDYAPEKGALHDYCTSPAVNNWKGVDSTGPCARHDICYEDRMNNNAARDRDCQDPFLNNLRHNCRYFIYPALPAQPSLTHVNRVKYCDDVAALYYQIVKRDNLNGGKNTSRS